jgi:hypothetical protein
MEEHNKVKFEFIGVRHIFCTDLGLIIGDLFVKDD